MDKTKINYYLLAIFIVLLIANIYFYFLKDRDKIVLADLQCPGFNDCPDAASCIDGGGGGGNLELKSFKVQTFLCGDGVNWNAQPWQSAKADGKPNTDVAPPPTTSQAAFSNNQTCNVTNAGEPINVIAQASSSQQATLWIQFIDPQGSSAYKASTTASGILNLETHYSPPSSKLGTWTVQASICQGQSQPTQGSNCITNATSVKVYYYQCGSPLGGSPGTCFAVINDQNFYKLDISNGNWCGFWINAGNGKGCEGMVR